MDPEKIRENMRKLIAPPAPLRAMSPAREIARKADSAKPPAVKRGPRGGQYTEATTKEGRRYRRYF